PEWQGIPCSFSVTQAHAYIKSLMGATPGFPADRRARKVKNKPKTTRFIPGRDTWTDITTRPRDTKMSCPLGPGLKGSMTPLPYGAAGATWTSSAVRPGCAALQKPGNTILLRVRCTGYKWLLGTIMKKARNSKVASKTVLRLQPMLMGQQSRGEQQERRARLTTTRSSFHKMAITSCPWPIRQLTPTRWNW